MAVSAILFVTWAIFRAIGAVGFPLFTTWKSAFPYAFAVMLCFTAAAHFDRRRNDLQAMVPRWVIDPALVVFITGILELAGAAGLLLRFTRPLAVVGLVLLLLCMFPANVKAAHEHLTIGGKHVTPLAARALIQAVFILLLIWCVS